VLRRRRGKHAAAALADLVSRPALLDGLMFHARRGQLRAELQPFADRADRRSDPLATALASLHADGFVREAAVAAMATRSRWEFVPFLLERAVEWVEPVRARALAALAEMLAEPSDPHRLPVARGYRRVAARRHAPALAALLDPTAT
jgi:hypothetical protein